VTVVGGRVQDNRQEVTSGWGPTVAPVVTSVEGTAASHLAYAAASRCVVHDRAPCQGSGPNACQQRIVSVEHPRRRRLPLPRSGPRTSRAGSSGLGCLPDDPHGRRRETSLADDDARVGSCGRFEGVARGGACSGPGP
jgi:hypothetical protein